MPNTRVGKIHEKTRYGRAEQDFTFDPSEYNQIHKISRPNRQTLRYEYCWKWRVQGLISYVAPPLSLSKFYKILRISLEIDMQLIGDRPWILLQWRNFTNVTNFTVNSEQTRVHTNIIGVLTHIALLPQEFYSEQTTRIHVRRNRILKVPGENRHHYHI